MNWDNLGFVICKPDAVYLHLEQEILSFLRQKGFQILACKYVTITPDLCKLLYWDGYRNSPKLWELKSEFFHLGESLCVLVQGTPQSPYKSVSELISQKWKGDFRPEKVKEGTVRHTFGSMSRIFNLFHSSDCTSAAKKEAALFFTDKELGRSIYQGVSCLPKQKKKRNLNLDVTDIYFRIKQQCIQASSIHPEVKRKYRNYIDEKHYQAMGVSKSEKEIWLYKTLKKEYRKFYHVIHEDELLKCITDYEGFKKIDYDTLFQVFAAMDLNLTKWETCLLKTTMLNF
ncbi:nucleoside-diphosphate kinase [Ectobacillus funiculus]|uniref:nucleoside-diphosphate kinase n=1 Tax=Ectobacillus funiculus TaxID=137993 RepID=A0ABV5WC99_9BACI